MEGDYDIVASLESRWRGKIKSKLIKIFQAKLKNTCFLAACFQIIQMVKLGIIM